VTAKAVNPLFFGESVLPRLKKSDLIIEMHYIDRSIGTSVEGHHRTFYPDLEFVNKFVESHNIQRIYPKKIDVRDYCLGYLSARTISEFVYVSREENAEWSVLRSNLAGQSK